MKKQTTDIDQAVWINLRNTGKGKPNTHTCIHVCTHTYNSICDKIQVSLYSRKVRIVYKQGKCISCCLEQDWSSLRHTAQEQQGGLLGTTGRLCVYTGVLGTYEQIYSNLMTSRRLLLLLYAYMCTHVCICVLRPDYSLECHPQEHQPTPLKQGLTILDLADQARLAS